MAQSNKYSQPSLAPFDSVKNYTHQQDLLYLSDPEGPVASVFAAVKEDNDQKEKLAIAQAQQFAAAEEKKRLELTDAEVLSGQGPDQEITEDEKAVAISIQDEVESGNIMLSKDASDQEILDYYKTVGSPELGEAIVNPSIQALVPTTGPEFLVAGAAASTKLAGKAGLHLWAAATPADSALVPYVDEIAEGNWFAGLAVGVLTGVATGVAANKVLDRALQPWNATGTRAFEETLTGIREQLRPRPFDGLPNKAAKAAKEAKAAKAPEATPWTVAVAREIDAAESSEVVKTYVPKASIGPIKPGDPVTSGIAAKQEDLARRKLTAAVSNGDLRDPVVRKVLAKATDSIPANSLAPEEATAVEALRTRIARVEENPPRIDANLNNPAADHGGQKVPKRVLTALHAKVSAEWYGPIISKGIHPTSTEAKTRDRLITDMMKADPKLSQEQARDKVVKDLTTIELVDNMKTRLLQSGHADDEALSDKAWNLVRKKKALGHYGAIFQSELTSRVDTEMARLRQAGAKPRFTEVQNRIEQALIQEFKEGIAEDVKFQATRVNPDSLLGQKSEYVRGGLEDPDARFPTPQGAIVPTATGYRYSDWDITDHMEIIPDSNTLKWSEAPVIHETPQPNTNKSKIFTYSTIGTVPEMQQRASMFITAHLDPKANMTRPAKGIPPRYLPADKLKVPTKIYSPKSQKMLTISALPESEVHEVARVLGWSDDLVMPFHSVPPGYGLHPEGAKPTVFQMSPEDIVSNYYKKLDWDKLFPGSVEKQMDRAFEKLPKGTLPATEAQLDDAVSPTARMMSSAFSVYRKQREQYIIQKLKERGILQRFVEVGKNKDGSIRTIPEASAARQVVDRIAVMRNALVNDMRRLTNSPDQVNSKNMYLTFGDVLAGTKRYESARLVTRGAARRVALREAEAYGATVYDPADTDARIASIADRENVSLEDAEEIYYRDLFAEGSRKPDEDVDAETEILRIMSADDTSDIPVMSREEAEEIFLERQIAKEDLADELSAAEQQLAEEAGEDSALRGQSEDLLGTRASVETGPDVRVKPTRLPSLASSEELMTSEFFSKIEDKLGSRFVDDIYAPSLIGQSGRVNLLRVNSAEDLGIILARFDKPSGARGSIADALLYDIDSEAVLGIKAYPGHSQGAVNRLATVLLDMQSQTAEAAKVLLAHPTDSLSALAFDKLVAIESAFATHLANGAPAEQSLQALVIKDFSADSEGTAVDQVVRSIRDNYAVYETDSQAMVDTRVSVMYAEMYADLATTQQRGAFMRQQAAYLPEPELGRAALVAARNKLSRQLKILCSKE